MARHFLTLPVLTIASGQTSSNAISLAAGINTKVALGSLIDLIVYAPTTLPEATVVEVAPIESPSASDWRTLYVGGADLAVPAGKAVVVPIGAAKALRVTAGGAVGANRVFSVVGQTDAAH